VSYDEPLTRTDNRINDPPLLSSQEEIPFGKSPKVNDLDGWYPNRPHHPNPLHSTWIHSI